MLAVLKVKNLSVIEECEVEFKSGLNIITGETGAGKSVLMSAVKLLLGERFNREIMRDEAEKLVVEGVFGGAFTAISDDFAEQFEIDRELIIRREVDGSGKSKIYINGMLATLNQLKEVTAGLADIHGQHEHQKLLNPQSHIEFLDEYVPDAALSVYRDAYGAYSELKNKISRIKADMSRNLQEKDMYEFQLNEIDSMNIDTDEDSKIDEKVNFLSHIEKIKEKCAEALSILRDGEVNASEMIGQASGIIDSVSEYSEELTSVSENLTECDVRLTDTFEMLENVFDAQELDPHELENLSDRKYKLNGLMSKYGPTLEDVVNHAETVREKLENLFFDESKLEKLEADLAELAKKAEEKADELNTQRREAASVISSSVERILGELELKNSVFNINMEKTGTLDENAGIECEFHISTNPGFDPAPLAKVASGGEISRVMLALKEVFSEADGVSTLIFDEIDTGISGVTAKKVAKKLKILAKHKQIMVITHLPVVAAGGDIHYHIVKDTAAVRARTNIIPLDDEGRRSILAMMTAGDVTESALEQADELLAEGRRL